MAQGIIGEKEKPALFVENTIRKSWKCDACNFQSDNIDSVLIHVKDANHLSFYMYKNGAFSYRIMFGGSSAAA
jgi:hypothetical protein